MDPIQFGENLSEYETNDIQTGIDGIKEELNALFDAEAPSSDDVSRARELSTELERLNAELEARAAKEAEVAAEFESLKAQFQSVDAPEGDEDPEAEVVQETEETEETPAGTTPEVAEETVETVTAPEPVAVTASARARAAAVIRRPAAPVRQEPEAVPSVQINVAPDVPGYSSGSALPDFTEVAKAFESRTKGFGGNSRMQLGVATFTKPVPDDLIVKGSDPEADSAVIDYAGSDSRLEGGSLVAAGGWCAPSETIYDLCEGGSTEGLFTLPEVQINRGGVRYTNGPDFSALYSGGFTLTEAQVIAGTQKPCVDIPCPPFEEKRLDAVGICLTSPILTERGYPELVAAFIREAMIAHQHRVAGYRLDAVVAAAGTALSAGNLGSIAGGALTTVELVAEGERAKHRWGMNETLEVVAPHWFRTALRADYAMRNGVDLQAVSDQTIQSYFAARNLSLQFVYGWQPLPEDAVEFPATVSLLVYRAGTFVAGTQDVISLSAVYDKANLQQNQYTALFFEEGQLVLQRCYGAKLVTVPVCVAGRTGANDVVECLTA